VRPGQLEFAGSSRLSQAQANKSVVQQPISSKPISASNTKTIREVAPIEVECGGMDGLRLWRRSYVSSSCKSWFICPCWLRFIAALSEIGEKGLFIVVGNKSVGNVGGRGCERNGGVQFTAEDNIAARGYLAPQSDSLSLQHNYRRQWNKSNLQFSFHEAICACEPFHVFHPSSL
jgi:hypothetical protein